MQGLTSVARSDGGYFGSNYFGSSLFFRNNPTLESIAALGGLTGALPRGIFIWGCHLLRNLSGLLRIISVGRGGQNRSLDLRHNHALESITGLGGLTGALPGGIVIWDCAGLRTLSGLQGITSVGKDWHGRSLDFRDNHALESIIGTTMPRR